MMLDGWKREDAERRAQLGGLLAELDAMNEQLKRTATGIGLRYQTLHNYYLDCLGVFETEGWYAFADEIASNLLLAFTGAGLSNAASRLAQAGAKHAAKQSAQQTARQAGKQTASHGGLCFVAGTQVVVDDGTGGKATRSIEDVQVGDLVWSRCDETGDEGFKPVTHLFVTHPVELIHLSYRRESGSSGDDPDLSAIAARRRSLGAVGLAAADSILIGTRSLAKRCFAQVRSLRELPLLVR